MHRRRTDLAHVEARARAMLATTSTRTRRFPRRMAAPPCTSTPRRTPVRPPDLPLCIASATEETGKTTTRPHCTSRPRQSGTVARRAPSRRRTAMVMDTALRTSRTQSLRVGIWRMVRSRRRIARQGRRPRLSRRHLRALCMRTRPRRSHRRQRRTMGARGRSMRMRTGMGGGMAIRATDDRSAQLTLAPLRL